MSKSELRRHKVSNYIAVPREMIRDRELGDKEVGTYTRILGLPEFKENGEPFDFSVEGYCSYYCAGSKATYAALDKLVEGGWIVRTQEKDEHGRWEKVIYDLLPEKKPLTQKRHAENRNTENRNTENGEQIYLLSKITSHNSARACACEGFYAALMESESAVEALCMKYSLTKENLQKKVEEFEIHCKAGGVEHADVKDCQRHFRDWLSYNIYGGKNNGTTASRDTMRQADADRRREECAAAIRAELEGAVKVEDPTGLLE